MIYKIKDVCSPCVYLLKKDGIVVYVGSSKVGITRALSHFGTKDYDEVELILCDLSLITSLETEKIIEYNPIYNIGFPSSTTYMSIAQIQKKIRGVIDKTYHHKPTIYKKMRAKGIKPVHQDIYRVDDVKFLWEELTVE